MGLLDMLGPGKQVADTVTGIVEGVGKTLQDLGIVALNEEQKSAITEKVNKNVLEFNNQLIEVYKTEVADLTSARGMASQTLQDAPKWIKGMSAIVTPIGGIGALVIFFGNILAGFSGWFHRIALTSAEELTIQLILAFFFGYRYMSKMNGIAGKY